MNWDGESIAATLLPFALAGRALRLRLVLRRAAMVHGDAEIGSTETTPYSPLHDSTPSVARLSAPLLLAIAGSALTPLPCAFSLSGIALGTATMLAIAAANDFTSVLMVRAAARLGVSGYEEVVLAAGGRRALNCCRIALVILLFGTMCGCLAAIQETGVHAVGELASTTGSTTARWLAATEGGRALLLVTITVAVLLPLSLASLGELPFVSSVGVCLMVGVAGYVLFAATSVGADYDEDEAASVASSAAASLPSSWLGVARAASTFGYAFYVQPCAVPLLRTVPAGEHGVQALVWALHLTFALTTLTYLTVGLGGLVAFSAGGVPQNLLQGFPGRMGGVLAGVFCAYLMLCFSPTVIPLRETLVRLYYESSMSYFVSLVTPRPQRAEVHITPDGSEVCNTRLGPCWSMATLSSHEAALPYGATRRCGSTIASTGAALPHHGARCATAAPSCPAAVRKHSRHGLVGWLCARRGTDDAQRVCSNICTDGCDRGLRHWLHLSRSDHQPLALTRTSSSLAQSLISVHAHRLPYPPRPHVP